MRHLPKSVREDGVLHVNDTRTLAASCWVLDSELLQRNYERNDTNIFRQLGDRGGRCADDSQESASRSLSDRVA